MYLHLLQVNDEMYVCICTLKRQYTNHFISQLCFKIIFHIFANRYVFNNMTSVD